MLSGRSVAKLRLKVLSPRLNLKYYVEDSNHSIKKNKCVFICHIHNYTEYNQRWNVFSVFNPSKCAHTWSSGHTHTHAHTPGAVDTHTRTHTHLEQWTHTHTHLEQWTHTHTHTHTHLEQWTHTHTHLDQWGFVRGAVGGSVPCSRVSPQSWTIPARAEIRTHNLGLQVRRYIH